MVKFLFHVYILTKVSSQFLHVFLVVYVLFQIYFQVWISPRNIKCVFVVYSRTQKEYRCYSSSTRKYFLSADVTFFFESVPYFSPQGPLTASESISLSPPVLLLAPSAVHDVSSPVSLKDTTAPPHQSHLGKKISNMSILIGKKFLPLNRFRPPPLQWKVHLLSRRHLPLILMFLLPSAKVNGLVLIILSFILFHMIVLLPLSPV